MLAKHGIEIPLERVNTVFFSQSILERMVGSGDLVIESAGELGRQNFSNVRKPSAVQNEIYRQMESNENRKFDRIGNRAQPPAAAQSVPEQIQALDALRQQGVLTDAEFQAKKADLLNRM
ncbi:MAG: SHOCT domain-containing protein [Acidimicrobiales bacterium]